MFDTRLPLKRCCAAFCWLAALFAATTTASAGDGCDIQQLEDVYTRYDKGQVSSADQLVTALEKTECSKADAHYQTFLMILAKKGYSRKNKQSFHYLKRAADFGHVNGAILLGELAPKLLDKHAFKIIVDNMKWSPYAKHVAGGLYALKKADYS